MSGLKVVKVVPQDEQGDGSDISDIDRYIDRSSEFAISWSIHCHKYDL